MILFNNSYHSPAALLRHLLLNTPTVGSMRANACGDFVDLRYIAFRRVNDIILKDAAHVKQRIAHVEDLKTFSLL